jgi:signal transduction histidine kinase
VASTRTTSTGPVLTAPGRPATPAVAATTTVGLMVGTLVLAGWALDVAALKSLVPGWPTMSANSAASFAFIGLAVWLLSAGHPAAGHPAAAALGRALAGVVAGVGIITLAEYASGRTFGIDELLFEDLATPLAEHPGRPAVATAVGLACLGIAVALWDATNRWARLTMWSLIGIVSLIAFNALVSYAYVIELSGPFHTMAFPTAATFLAISFGIMLAHPDRGPVGVLNSRYHGGMTARRLIPAAVIGPVFVGLLTLAGNRADLYSTDFRLTVFVTLTVAMLATIVLANAVSLDRHDAERAKADTDRALATALADEAFHALEASNRRLEASNERLAAANKELEAFSYSVSHDLRAPLRAIDGFSRILVEEHASALPEDTRGYLLRVRGGAQRMGRLIDDLLMFAQLGRQGMTEHEVKPTEIAQRALASLQDQYAGRNVEVNIADLPPCQADPALLEQVYVNLLSNALKFTRDRDPARVEVGWHEEDGNPAYTVSDNGAGFDEQYAHKLFGVFQRLHRTEEFEGTGVGLALVQRIIHRHGGRIWATSQPDQGATFTFTLADGPPA